MYVNEHLIFSIKNQLLIFLQIEFQVNDLRSKLTDTQKKNDELEEKCKCSLARVEEMSKTQIEKDKEYNALRKKLSDKLRLAQQEETKYLELAGQFENELGTIRQELEVRTFQLDDVKKNAQEINSSRCVQLACAQEEVNRLKEELNRLLRKHCALNVEVNLLFPDIFTTITLFLFFVLE